MVDVYLFMGDTVLKNLSLTHENLLKRYFK